VVRSLVILLVLLAAAPVRADETKPKSEQTAQLAAGLGTGVSGGLILAGFLAGDSSYPYNKPLMYTGLASALITPSLGQIYAGEYITIGMAARVLGVGIGTYGLTHYTEVTPCDPGHAPTDTCRHIDSGAIPFLGLAAIAFVGGMAYDVADASSAVQRWNEHHGFMVAPTVVPATDGPAPGLSFVGQW
jgi:hypothetical protein